jgi:hypothetical protein
VIPRGSGNRSGVRTFLVLLLGVLALAGCGDSGGPPIEQTVAAKLANQADAVAKADNACAARTHARILQRQTIAAINAGSIPPAYQETLQSRVNEIAGALELRCLPTPTPASTESTAPPPAPVVVSVAPTWDRGRAKDSRGKSHRKGYGKGDKGHDD